MPTMFVLVISLLLAAIVGILVVWGSTVFFESISTPDPLGARNSGSPPNEEIWSPKKPSIERSEKNSMASITVQANPDRPLAYTVEPVNGSSRLVKLTVLYEQSLDDSELAILKYVDSDSKWWDPASNETVNGVDDPAWIARVNTAREKL